MKLGWSETGTSNTSLVFFAKFRSFSCPNESKNSTRDIHPNVWLEDSSVAPPRSVYCHIKQRNGESIHPSIHPSNPSIESIHRIHPAQKATWTRTNCSMSQLLHGPPHPWSSAPIGPGSRDTHRLQASMCSRINCLCMRPPSGPPSVSKLLR